ncbi:MAG: hypothetical protein ACRD5D_06805 [Candidatus Polarisedimenticolia bacterium]
MLPLVAILLVGATAAWVLAPIVSGRAAPLLDGSDLEMELRELQSLKDVTFETLRDVEYDYHAGKIGESDYRSMHDRFSREAAEVLTRIDALQARLGGDAAAGRRQGA